jgi:hypothetical protein
VLIASIIRVIIALMMEAASTSETSVNFYQTTWCYNLEDIHLQSKSCSMLPQTELLERQKERYNGKYATDRISFYIWTTIPVPEFC